MNQFELKFFEETGEEARGNDMWGSKGVNPDYIEWLEKEVEVLTYALENAAACIFVEVEESILEELFGNLHVSMEQIVHFYRQNIVESLDTIRKEDRTNTLIAQNMSDEEYVMGRAGL
jgi:hypothetical protein